MSKLSEFKVYLIARLKFLESQRKGDAKQDSEVDLAISEVEYILANIYLTLEEERKDDLRGLEQQRRGSIR